MLSEGIAASATQQGPEVEKNLVNEDRDHLTLNGSQASHTDIISSNQILTNTEAIVPSTENYGDIYNNGFPFLNQNLGLNLDDRLMSWNLDFGQDMDFGMYEIDLEGIELEYSNLNSGQAEEKGVVQSNMSGPTTNKSSSNRYAAFERSPWLWTPTSKDQTLNDQEHISLNEGNIPVAFEPVSPGASLHEFAHCSINTRTRDEMLSLVVSLPKVITRNISFPSLALLNTIIQVYFAQESDKVDTFIHSALEPTTALPHLMISIVSGGSMFISTPAIWKMGLALQEIVRHTVGDFVCIVYS